MIQLKLVLFILSTFFTGTNGNIAAEKTTVIVHPNKQQIEILHQDLLSIIQLEQDSINAIEQWRELYTSEPEN